MADRSSKQQPRGKQKAGRGQKENMEYRTKGGASQTERERNSGTEGGAKRGKKSRNGSESERG